MRLRRLGFLLFMVSACAPQPGTEPGVGIVVAARDLPAGTVLAHEDLADAWFPQSFLQKPELYRPAAERVAMTGEVLEMGLKKGDPVLRASSLSSGPLSAIVQKKGRAFTVPIQGAELATVNDHIDVLATVNDPSVGETVAVTLLQKVLVLANPGGGRLTLLALPEEAELLAQAVGSKGVLYLALRNPEDINVLEDRSRATLQSVMTGERLASLLKLRLSVYPPAAHP